MERKCDFSGWATRNDLICGDGRVIKKDAFKDNDGKTVSLVWNHEHDDPNAVLGHAILENRDEGVYTYGFFNDSENGRLAKNLVKHGDVSSLSIYANKLRQNGNEVVHGDIRELSLVLAGANPGAYIDFVMSHSDDGNEEASELYASCNENIVLYHSDDTNDEETKEIKHSEEEEKMADTKEKTVQEVFDELTDEQKTVVYALIGQALEDAGVTDEEEDDDNVKHNIFDNTNDLEENVLSHSDMETIIADGKRFGTLKESFLAHAAEYGIDDPEGYLFPEFRSVNGETPEFITRKPDGWVDSVMKGVKHTPFSRIKMVYADLTTDEARAKGYMKGNLKKEEVFALLKRTVTPTTIYKKQKLDRDDVIDITDFDVVAWLKKEMRLMLDEEIARAILFGDGRSSLSEDKINEKNVIPVASDVDLYTIKTTVTVGENEEFGHAIINAAVRAQDTYEGSGNTTFYTSASTITDMLLLEDGDGRRMYKDMKDLALAMNVDSIVKVPSSIIPENVYGVIVDLSDYNVGADKGGAVNMFDDFDIDYNQQKYLIETRCSGALVKPYSAIVLNKNV